MTDEQYGIERVRRELDDLCLLRALGGWTDDDRRRYRELCLLEDRLRRAA